MERRFYDDHDRKVNGSTLNLVSLLRPWIGSFTMIIYAWWNLACSKLKKSVVEMARADFIEPRTAHGPVPLAQLPQPTRQLIPKIKPSPPKAHFFYEPLITLIKRKEFSKSVSGSLAAQ